MSVISFAQHKDEAIIDINYDSIPFVEVALGTSYSLGYTLSAENLTQDLTVSVIPGQGFSISGNGSDWSYSYTLSQSGGSISETALYVKFAPNYEIGYSTNISHNSDNYTVDLPVFGIGIGANEGYIIAHPFKIDFGNVPIGGNSLAEFWYDIENDNPTSAAFYFPFLEGFTSGTGASWFLTDATEDNLGVLFSPFEEGFFEGDLEIQSTASGKTRYVHVTGSGILVSMSLSAESFDFGNVEIGNYSDEYSYIVSGNSIQSDIEINAPYGFGISLTSGTGFTNQIAISAQDINLNDIQIFVRFAPQIATPYIGDIFHETDYTEIQTITLSGNGVLVGTKINDINTSTFKVYPNPSNGFFTIENNFQSSIINSQLTITDINGKTIYITGHVPFQIDLSNYPKGIYFLKFLTKNKFLIDKLIIQ